MSFEMADASKPEEIIKATQASVIKAIQEVITGLKEEVKAPGLTWEQIEYILQGFADKQPTIIKQDREF